MASSAKTRDINLLIAMDRQRSASRKGTGFGIVIPIIVIVLVAVGMGAGYSYFYSNTSEVRAKKETIELYLSDPSTQAAYNESLTAKSEAARMTTEMSSLGDVILNISSYPDLQGGDIEQVREAAGNRVKLSAMTYDKTTGVLSFNATSTTVTGVPLFIAQMRITGIFSDVQYQGYAETVRTETEIKRVWDDGIWDYRQEQIEHKFTEYNFAVTALVNAQTPYLPPSIGGPAYSPDGDAKSPGEGGATGGGAAGGGYTGGGK